MITLKVGIGILALGAVLWLWAWLRDRKGTDPSERTYPPEPKE